MSSDLSLNKLQESDSLIEEVVVYSKYAVCYLLQQEQPNPGWRKANIEGPIFLLRRKQSPRYQLLVKNQNGPNDLLDDLHPDWEVDCQPQYVFYNTPDQSQKIRGIWFHNDAERIKIEKALEKAMAEVRQGITPNTSTPAKQGEVDDVIRREIADLTTGIVDSGEIFYVNKESLKQSLLELGKNDAFLDTVLANINEKIEKEKQQKDLTP